jgi:hypothetical protein
MKVGVCLTRQKGKIYSVVFGKKSVRLSVRLVGFFFQLGWFFLFTRSVLPDTRAFLPFRLLHANGIFSATGGGAERFP